MSGDLLPARQNPERQKLRIHLQGADRSERAGCKGSLRPDNGSGDGLVMAPAMSWVMSQLGNSGVGWRDVAVNRPRLLLLLVSINASTTVR